MAAPTHSWHRSRGAELAARWARPEAVPGKAGAMLLLIARCGDTGIPIEEVAEHVGMEPSGGGFRNYLGRLRALGLIDRGNPVVAAEELRS